MVKEFYKNTRLYYTFNKMENFMSTIQVAKSMQHAPDTTQIKLLPEEMVLHIFSFLNPDSLLKIAEVSKAFRALSENRDLWFALSVKKFSKFNAERLEKRYNGTMKAAYKATLSKPQIKHLTASVANGRFNFK